MSTNTATPSAAAAPASAPTETSTETKGATGVQSQSGANKPETGKSAEAPKQETAAAAAERKWKVKINGAEQEVDEKELLEGYQTRKAADEKFREASMMRKQAEEFITLLKQNPVKVLSDPRIGHDVRKLAEEYLVAQLEEEMLDPKDKELRDLKKEKEERTKKEEDAKKQAQEAEQAEMTKKYAEDYSKDIVGALQASGLPKTEHTVKRMAYYMKEGLKRGMDLKAAQVVSLVKEDYLNEQKDLVSNLDGDALINMFGPEMADKIRKHDLAKLKNPAAGLRTPEKQPEGGPSSQPAKKFSKDDWKAKLERIKRGEE